MCEVHKPEKWLENIKVIFSDGKRGTINDLKPRDAITIINNDGSANPISLFIGLNLEKGYFEYSPSKNCILNKYPEHVQEIRVLSAANLLDIIRSFQDDHIKKSQNLWG
jgi:hypothetical protein